jgi:AcrR family transcriptional regulator
MIKNKLREEKRKIVTEHIINVAENVFFSKTYEDATVDEIALHCGITKKTLYSYLSGKEEIYDRIAVRGYKTLCKYLLGALKPSENPKENMKNLFDAGFSFVRQCGGYARIIMNYNTRSKNGKFGNESYKFINQINEEVLKIIENNLSEGIKNNIFKKDINVKITALYLTSVFTGLADTAYNRAYYLTKVKGINDKDFIAYSVDAVIESLSL